MFVIGGGTSAGEAARQSDHAERTLAAYRLGMRAGGSIAGVTIETDAGCCAAALALGVTLEIMMVQWTVTMARNVPPGLLARVSSYDVLGSVGAMPIGALAAGPIAAAIGVSATQYGAAALIVIASALALIPREARNMRSTAPADADAERDLALTSAH